MIVKFAPKPFGFQLIQELWILKEFMLPTFGWLCWLSRILDHYKSLTY